jgi:hypothetical protein
VDEGYRQPGLSCEGQTRVSNEAHPRFLCGNLVRSFFLLVILLGS